MERERPYSPWQEWRIIDKIGEGSYGKVYKAQRIEQGRRFYSAIKVISVPSSRSELSSVRAETHNNASLRNYFQDVVEECTREICTMEYFRGNSHIVSVEDFKVLEYLDDIGWDIYIRMEYLTSFNDYCTSHTLTERSVIKLGIDLCKALEYCGQLSIIHRDIKPENIFISRFGDFKLGDFGIARELERSLSSMSKKGTFAYMAPEIYHGERYDSSVDIYSLGIVLYKLMNKNRLPFISLDKQLITYHDKENALSKRMNGEPLPVPCDASEELAEIILKACAFNVKERYSDPEQMRQDLEKLRRGEYIAGSKARSVGKGRKTTDDFHGQDTSYEHSDDRDSEHRDPETRDALYGSSPKRIQAKSRQPIWMSVLLVIAASACVFSGIYIKRLYDGIRQPISPGSALIALYTNDSSSAQIDDFSLAIQTVNERTNAVIALLPECTVEGTPGERQLFYNHSGDLVRAVIYADVSESGMVEEYYFWNHKLFFTYLWNDSVQALYYYNENGDLIRWIDTAGKVHDRSIADPDYASAGARYWNTSIDLLEQRE